jgi:4-hydroxybenzoate polyprenyltransferase
LYFMPFCGGLAAAKRLDGGTALLAAAFWLTLSLAIEVTNRLSDRAEDEINRRERTSLCAQVGWGALRALQGLLWGAIAAATLAWLALAPGTLLAAILFAGACAGLGYSRGPRFSRRRLLVFVVLSGTFVGPFSLGWASGPHGAGIADFGQLGSFTSLFWVMTFFITSLAGIKDISDRAGDQAIGYRSAFLALVDRHGAAVLVLVAAVPYAALAAFAVAGALPARMLALLALLPCSIALALAARGARGDARGQLAVREAFYCHWLAFTGAALLTFEPSGPLLAAVLGSGGAWVLASRWLHWGEPLRLEDARRVARLARAGLTTGEPAPQVAPTHEGHAWATT